ncbi:MAG: aminotransferase class V-fold PLP-dependent enzyme, partial [Clostridia bacterium]|nr:aminotransferase class V-fold PLP-dependent enzyme [Clostridia bacterium]
MAKQIYFDNAATTQAKPEVVAKMLTIFTNQFGNPSSLYNMGEEAKKIVEDAREKVAMYLGALPEEIYFTSGGTESDNWA